MKTECVRTAVGGVLRCLAIIAGAVLVAVAPAGAGGSDAPDPDACAMASARDIGAMINPDASLEIRSRSGHPEPGESTCVWSTHQKGLTDDAPPDGQLSLAFYHMASPARAAREMRRLATTPSPPSLVRTTDPQDEVLRPDADTVVARHGSDIVVVDVVRTRTMARYRAGWTFRVEAMALAAAGARVLGPADELAAAPVCKRVSAAHVLAILSLSPSTLAASDDASDDGRRCTFNVKDASPEPGNWTNNRGDAQFTLEDLGNNAAALARLKADMPFNRASDLVATADSTDRVVSWPDRPEGVEAVHGPYLVTLNLSDVTAAARAHPTWVYRVQRTALEMAGATIVPKPGQVAEPVTPGPPPAPAAFAWHTSGHVAPSFAAMTDPVLHVVAFLARHRFFLMPVLIGGPILLATFLNRQRASRPSRPAIIGYDPEPPRRKARGYVFAPLCIVFAVVNLLFGTSIANALIHAYGAEGQATISGSYATGTIYNNHRVRGHNVLIKTAAGDIVETSFEDDDFNVYPSHNATFYPDTGDRFNVRYLTRFPQDFVILGEDDSPWAQTVRCGKLGRTRSEAETKLKFAPDLQSYRDAAAAARQAEAEAGCRY